MPAYSTDRKEKRRKLARVVRRVELACLWFAIGSPVLFVYKVVDGRELLKLYAVSLVAVLACDWWIGRYGYSDNHKGADR